MNVMKIRFLDGNQPRTVLREVPNVTGWDVASDNWIRMQRFLPDSGEYQHGAIKIPVGTELIVQVDEPA